SQDLRRTDCGRKGALQPSRIGFPAVFGLVRETIPRQRHLNESVKSPKALIFDMDGVLVDSEPLHKRAKEMAFHEAGIHFPESTYESYKGRPDATMFHEVLAGRSVEEIAELLHCKHQFFEKIEHELQPVPGAAEFVKWAAGRYRLALATSATPRNRAAALQSLGIAHCF